MSSPEGHLPTAIAALSDAGVSFVVHRHPAARNAEELHLTGLDVNTSAKTLAFTAGDERIILAAIPGLARLRYPKLAAALGVPRSALRPAGPEVLAHLGMEPGGVAPFSPADNVTLVLERSLLELDRCYCGGGSPTVSVQVNPADLLTCMPGTIVADLCDDAVL